jgi:hypothetical protein
MLSKLRFWLASAMILAGLFCAAQPAAAGECIRYYGCGSAQPRPYPYLPYYRLGHGPDHDYSPMDFNDGHGGHIYGRWLWGGNAWGYIPLAGRWTRNHSLSQ